MPLTEPLLLFFALGLFARAVRSPLQLPSALSETLSMFLLLAIGLKGGAALAEQPVANIATQLPLVIGLGIVLTLAGFPILHYLGRFSRADAASIAAHYGSVSAGTFAVALAYLASANIWHEAHMVVFMVVLEMPAIVVGILLVRRGSASTGWQALLHEAFLGKSMVLLAGGLLIGWLAGPEGLAPLKPVFFDLFKGVLALFLLDMGLVAGERLREIRRAGAFLLGFAVTMPLAAAGLGLLLGQIMGLSLGGGILLAVMAASASYIAVPAAMKSALPEANLALPLTAALAVTFPFNVLLGIPLYHRVGTLLY